MTWSDGAQYAGLTVTRSAHRRRERSRDLHGDIRVRANGPASQAAPPRLDLPSDSGSDYHRTGRRVSRRLGSDASVPFHAGSAYLWFIDPDGRVTGTSSRTRSPHGGHERPHGPWRHGIRSLRVSAGTLDNSSRDEHSGDPVSTLSPCRLSTRATCRGRSAVLSRSRRVRCPRILRVSPAVARFHPPSPRSPSTSRSRSLRPTEFLRSSRATSPRSPRPPRSPSRGSDAGQQAIVRLGSDGSGTIGVQNNSPGTVPFILDVNGYFE